MKKSMLLLLLCLSVFSLTAQDTPVTVTETTVTSAILNKTVKVSVRLPDGYDASKKRYPVLYCLQALPVLVEDMAVIAQEARQREDRPEMIVIGIDGGDNQIDRVSDQKKYDKFRSFLEQELVPGIEKQYRVNGQRNLYQRAFSGSFALYVFLTKPTLFDGYVAASMDWYNQNNDHLTRLADKALQNPKPFKGKKIFLATMNGAYNNNIPTEVDKQMTVFAKRLEARSGGNIAVKYQAFDDWGPVPQPGLYEGLVFVTQKEITAASKANKRTMQQTKNGKWVILDSKKTTLYEVVMFDNGPDYPSEGLVRVMKNGKIGFVNAVNYTTVIEPQFDCAFPFDKGKAKVSNNCKTVKDGEYSIWESNDWKFIDRNGKY